MKTIIKVIRSIIMLAIICIITCQCAGKKDTTISYYISNDGDDSNTGLSSSKSWKTIEKINITVFQPGDRILFKGGNTFDGTLTFDSIDVGSKERPIIISSYGQGRAIINGDKKSGIIAENITGITIQNLNIIGAGYKSGNDGGINLVNVKDALIDSIDVTGFQAGGILTKKSSNIKITNIYAYKNGLVGIFCSGGTNVYIGYCRAINNPGYPTSSNWSGSGILVGSDISDCLIEYCEAAYNGWDQPIRINGPVGIWCYACERVTIQYCISHDNKSPTADGGGFDFDGGTNNSIMQYNYSYDNNGCGYLLCAWGGKRWCANNIIRYNISENDGQGTHNAGIIINTGEMQKDFQIYNNVIFNKNGRHCVRGEGIVPESFYFRNNIFVLRGKGMFVSSIRNGGTFQNNVYWNYDGAENWDGIKSLKEWRKIAGKEMLNGKPSGFNIDPQIDVVGREDKLTDPLQLKQLHAYVLKDTSPLIDIGLDLKALFQIDPGTHDFFGNSLPSGKGYDIGIYEHQK